MGSHTDGGWLDISSAPKDGTRIEFKNVDSGLTDVGHWCDYSHESEEMRELWPHWIREAEGEWSTDFGNGDMTHWRPLSAIQHNNTDLVPARRADEHGDVA